MGLIVAVVIVASVWSLTRDSLRLSLDGVPAGVDVDDLERRMSQVEGVEAVHHLHVWAISTTENALTAHVVLADPCLLVCVKPKLKELLAEAGIVHVTLECETLSEHCSGRCE